MTEPPTHPGRDDDAEAIQRYSWWRLRQAKLRNQANRRAEEWEQIEVSNHFGAGIEKAMRRWAAP